MYIAHLIITSAIYNRPMPSMDRETVITYIGAIVATIFACHAASVRHYVGRRVSLRAISRLIENDIFTPRKPGISRRFRLIHA